MKIAEAMRQLAARGYKLRCSYYGDRWLVCDENGKFTVYERRVRRTIILYEGMSENFAVAALIEESKD